MLKMSKFLLSQYLSATLRSSEVHMGTAGPVWESHATGIVSCSQSVQRSDAVHSTEGANSPSQQADLKSLVEF